MKEKIYTIPVNEAFSSDSECAFCYLEELLERDSVEYTLGAAMMEPDFRIESNKKGFCKNHYSMLFSKQNKLSLALILESHLLELTNEFETLLKNPKKNDKCSKWFLKNRCSCVICDRINSTMKRYVEVFFYMWSHDDEFKNKVINSKGFCLNHLETIYNNSFKYLNKKDAVEFLKIIYGKEKGELENIRNDIHKFTLKFDYRNKDMEWGSAIDAPIRTIEKLSGYIPQTNDK